MITSPLVLVALIAVVTAAAFWLDRNVAPLSKLGSTLMAILFGGILSNTGLVPAASPVYEVISGPVTSLAIVWLLLAVNLRDVRRAGPRMLGAFGLGVAGTIAGAVAGAFIFGSFFGAENWKLAGTLTGTYSGGGLNFVAVGRGVGLDSQLFVAASAADNVTTALWLAATLMLPLWLRSLFPAPVPLGAGGDENVPHPFFGKAQLSALGLAALLAVSLVLLMAAEGLASLVPWVPAVLWLTTLALILGHVRPFAHMPGAMQLGNLVLHFFFVVLGIYSRVEEILTVGIEVFGYTLVVVAVHGVVVYGAGRLLGLDLATLSVASQAAVGGPSSALGLAVGRDWPGLVLPAILVGLLGYAVGNYLGFAVGHLLKSVL